MAYNPVYLQPEDFDEVRDRLGGITADRLSDETITKASYLQAAEATVRRITSNRPGTGGDDALFLKVAAINETAANLVPKVRQLVKSEDIGDYKYVSLTAAEWQALQDSLHAAALEAVGNTEAPAAASSGFFFTTARPADRRVIASANDYLA